MDNARDKSRLPATVSISKPGDFPLGSVESRAAMRAIIERDASEEEALRVLIEFIGSPEKDRSISVPNALVGLRLRFQPKQVLFDDLLEQSAASWLGYGGSRGGAKSGGCRRSMVRRRLQYPGTTGQIIRRVWEDVRLNHVEKFFEEFPALLPYYRVAEHEVTIPTNGAPSTIKFDSAETETDVKRKAYGPEFMDIFVDQAEQFSEKELKLLKTTCRWPNTPEHHCKFGLFFNPGGIGAAFLRRVFYTHEYHERENPKDFEFLQAYGWDNVEWCREALRANGLAENDFYSWTDKQRFDCFITRSQYGRELNDLDASMRPGHLFGEFSRFAGQYFSNWNEAEHVIALEHVIFNPKWPDWPRWISIDWGFQHHTAVHWHTQAGIRNEDGSSRRLVITYKEYVRSGLSERALAEEIVAVNAGDKIDNIFGGHDLWNVDNTGPTKEMEMSKVFRAAGLPSMKKANTNRVNGWRLMHRMVDEDEWRITRNCTEAIAAMPTAIFDEKKQNEDILKTGDLLDDVRDSLRYGLYSQYAPRELSEEEQMRQETSHLSDPTSRAIFAQKRIAGRDKALRERGMVNNRSSARHQRYGKYGR